MRVLCDTAVAGCTVSTDGLGAEALVQNLQQGIHYSKPFAIPDLLPMDDAGAWNAPYGDVYFLRDHYSFVATNEPNLHNLLTPFDSCANTTTHQSNVAVTYGGAGTGCTAETPLNGPPKAECGGDVGGYIRPAIPANYTPFYGAAGGVAPGCASVGVPGDLQ
jgi:hypothetical protein